jgi:hypothetical protein
MTGPKAVNRDNLSDEDKIEISLYKVSHETRERWKDFPQDFRLPKRFDMLLRTRSGNLQVMAMLAAVVLGLAAQYFFTGEIFTHQMNSSTSQWLVKYNLALALLIFSAGLAAWAAFPRDKAQNEQTFAIHVFFDGARSGRVWLIASGVSYLLSILLYIIEGENGWVQLLWVAGIGFLVIPLWLQLKNEPQAERITAWEWMVVGIILLIGFGLRYWNLTEIPSHVDNDVALMGSYGIELIHAGNYDWIGYSASDHLLSYDQFIAWSMRLFGENHYGIVMASVILGTLSLPLVFLLGREFGGPFLGFMGAGLLAISYTHIHFSRILFGNSASFAALIVTYALFRGLRTREAFWFALSGVFAGLGLLLYDSSRVIPFILLSVMLWQWLWQRQSFKPLFRNWLILGAGALVAFGPMLGFAVLNFSSFAGRANVVTLWNPDIWRHELATYNTDSSAVVIVQQIWRTFLTLHLTGDSSPHFAFQRPMVSSFTALFFILGLAYAIFRIKEIRHFTIHAWIFLTFIFGGVLTADPPFWPHLNIALPPIVLVAAVGIGSFAVTLKKAFGHIGYKVTIWVMAGILLVTGINNWQVYYDYVKNDAGNSIRIARYLSSLPSSYYVYMISDEFRWGEYAFQFFSQGMEGQDLTIDMLEKEAPTLDRPAVFILFHHPELVPTLQSLYPDGEVENHYDYNNLVSFISYRVVSSLADVPAESPGVSQLSSPGWQLLFACVVFWIGYVAYAHYSAQEAAAVKNEPIDDLHLE